MAWAVRIRSMIATWIPLPPYEQIFSIGNLLVSLRTYAEPDPNGSSLMHSVRTEFPVAAHLCHTQLVEVEFFPQDCNLLLARFFHLEPVKVFQLAIFLVFGWQRRRLFGILSNQFACEASWVTRAR